MKLSNILAGMSLLLSGANAADMTHYLAGPGVEPSFRDWLERIYMATEDLTANHSFTDFFVRNTGRWTVGTTTVFGQVAIIALKYKLLPPNSNQIWSHVPNITTVYSETATDKTYQVNGVINKDPVGYPVNGVPINNCSSQYYQERFTVNKYNPNGAVNLAPYAYSLSFYNDYGLQPQYSPTDMPCQAPASKLMGCGCRHVVD